MEFSEACCEVDYILTNLNPEDKKKIPDSVINFFNENKSSLYKVNLTTDRPLAEQKLKDETKAFLQIINYKYFANKKQKEEFKSIFKEENEKKLLIENITINKENETVDNILENTKLIIYKENKISNFFKKILNIFKK